MKKISKIKAILVCLLIVQLIMNNVPMFAFAENSNLGQSTDTAAEGYDLPENIQLTSQEVGLEDDIEEISNDVVATEEDVEEIAEEKATTSNDIAPSEAENNEAAVTEQDESTGLDETDVIASDLETDMSVAGFEPLEASLPRDLLTDPVIIDITNAVFEAYDEGVKVTDMTKIPLDATINISYSFNLLDIAEDIGDPAGSAYVGDYFQIVLPTSLTNIASFTEIDGAILTAQDEGGDTYNMATLSVSSNGVATVTFLADVENLSEVTLNFNMAGSLEEAKLKDGDGASFQLYAGGTVYTIGFKDNTPSPPVINATIAKSGSYNAAANEITWTVTVSSGNSTDTAPNVKVVDTLGTKQTYISNSCSLGLDAAYVSNVGTDYTFLLGDVTGNKTFTYKTTPTDAAFSAVEGGTAAVPNTAAIYIDVSGVSTKKDEKTASVTLTTDWIEKEGTLRTVSGVNYIDWTITLNNHYRTIPAGSTVTDTLPPFLNIDSGSVRLNGGAVPGGDTATISGQIFTYTFGSNTTGVQVITFTTAVDATYYDQQDTTSFANKATINISGTNYSDTSPGVGVGTNLISKSGIGYNAATQKITWRLNVNSNKLNITAAKITDTIPNNQLFDEGYGLLMNDTPMTLASSEANVTSAANQYYYDAAAKKFTIYLGNVSSSEQPRIEYRTTVVSPSDYAANKTTTYSNSATLVGTNIVNSTTSGTQSVKSEVIAKTNTGYNYTTRVFSWKITVNQNKMPMPAAVVTDTIPTDQTFVAGSLKIDGVPATDTELAVSGNTLTITLGSISTQKEITFETRVADPDTFMETNGNITFSNTASLVSGIASAPTVSVTANKTVNNKSLEKKLLTEYTQSNGYIEWEVYVNSNQAPLNNSSLTDTLQDGLELDTETVQLYLWNQNSSGTNTIGTLVPATDYSFTYDYNTRVFTVKLPNQAQGYYLKFKTDVLKAGKYSNSISLNGSYTGSSNGASNVNVSSSNISAGATGKNGKITVKKVDAEGNPITTGAEIELLDSFHNVIKTLTTDSTGSLTFDKLKLRTYYIRESTPPLGYALDNTEQTVVLTSADTNKTVTIENSILTANIYLQKNDEGGIGIAGAEFKIYAKTDTAYSAPLMTATSDAYGQITFSGLSMGDYRVRETKAALGYALTTEVKDVSLVLDAEKKLPDVTVSSPFVNVLLDADIYLQKNDEKGNGLYGAVFGIYDITDSSCSTPLQIATSTLTGEIKFTDLKADNYNVKEITAPTGYILSDTVIPVSLVLDEDNNTLSDITVPTPIVNDPLKGSIYLQKNDDEGIGVKDAEFSIYSDSDTSYTTPLKTVKSDAVGKITFSGMEAGSYVIRETKAALGYADTDEVKNAELILDTVNNVVPDITISEPFVNAILKADVYLQKNNENGQALAGAEFGIYSAADSSFLAPLQLATSDETGQIKFSSLKAGNYNVKETKAPLGYALLTEVIPVLVQVDKTNNTLPDVTISAPIVNKLLTGDITVKITDKKGKPLKGGKFEIFDKKDTKFKNPLQVATSDKDGNVVFTDLPPGDYVIREKEAPAGYEKTNGTINVTLTLDEMDNTLTNVTLEAAFVNSEGEGSGKATTSDNTSQNVSANDDKAFLVQAGSFWDAKVLVGIGVILIAVGIIWEITRRRRKKRIN